MPRTKEQAGVAGRPAAPLRCRRRRGPDHLGRAAAHPAADGAGDQGPGHRPLRVDRLHLGQRGAAVREKFEEYGLDARAFAGIKVAAVGGRPRRRCASGASSPTWCRPASSRRAACSRTGRRTTRPRPDQPGLPAARRHRHRDPGRRPAASWAGRSTTSRPTARCGPRRRPRRSARRSRAAASTRSCSPRRSRCATWSASPASRTPSTVVACIGPATAKTAEEHGLRVDVLAPRPSRRGARRGAGRVRRGAARRGGRRPASRCCAVRAQRTARDGRREADVRPWPASPTERPRRLRRTPGAAPAGRRDPAAPGRPRAAGVRHGGR